jgi:sec-independent protein translocase protein TatC
MFKSKKQKLPKPKKSKLTPEEMSLWQHVGDLRNRLFKALIAMIIGTIISMTFGEYFIDVLARPIGGVDKLVSIEVTENVAVFMRVSLLGGFLLALPFILFQVLGFVLPGLTKEERRGLFLAIPFATLLFITGVVFAYFVMLPAALPFLISFIGVTTTPRLANYYSFVTNLLFWIGISFQTPLVVYILAKFGLVSPEMLARQWRFAVVIIAIISAFVTPTPDPINMGLLMVPLFVLYMLSILLAKIAVRDKKTETTVATTE